MDLKIKVAIIEDNRFIRSGLEIMLEAESDFELVCSYTSCEDAFYYEEISKAQIVLMDIRLPGISGIDGIKYLKRHFPEMLIIVCTAYEDDDNVFEAIIAGAVGFVSKKTPAKELLSTLRNAVNGGSPMTPNVARNIKSSFQLQKKNQLKNGSDLNEIENDILEKISVGKSYVTVSDELSVEESELFITIRSIYGKLQNKLIKIEY
jgi:DNA-binding NarL/FixJ family response regulator